MRITCLLAALCVPLCAAGADDAKSVFDSLFAAKIKAVSATADRDDDVTLAKDMLALAKTSANQPALVALLCDTAHDLGAKHADGYVAAAEALTLLADTVEEKKPAAREKLVALLTKQSTAGKPDEREPAGEALIDLLVVMGDEKVDGRQFIEAVADYRRVVALATQRKSASLDDAKAKLEFALSRDRTMKQLVRLQEKLLKDADSATAEEIVKLYVIELDDPESAKAYLNRVKDETLKTLVPLAAGAVDQVSEESLLKLGEWYKSLAKDPKSPQAAGVLQRAKTYLAKYLETHTAADLGRTKAEVMMKEIDAAVAAAPAASSGRTVSRREVDVLRLVDDKKDGMAGTTMSRGRLILTGTVKVWARVSLPVAMTGAYEMRMVFQRTAGNDDLSIVLPAGGRHILHVVDGWGTGTSALHCGGQRQNLAIASGGARITNGKVHTLVIAVVPDEKGQVQIRSQVDGKDLIDWSGRIDELGMNADEYPGHPGNPAIRNSSSTYVIQEIKIKALSGTVEPTEHLYATPRCGGWGGGRFHQLGPKGSMLVGFRGTAGRLVQSIQPIYRVGTKTVDGTLVRRHPDTAFEIVAKEGYAVGAINYSTGNFFDGFEAVFMKVKGDRLDPNDSYKSSWIGGRGGNNGTFSSDGAPIVGIHGGTGADFDGLGVIFRR